MKLQQLKGAQRSLVSETEQKKALNKDKEVTKKKAIHCYAKLKNSRKHMYRI